ncbi:TPA: replication protein [Klebsiella aerogenes]|nr:replication protein [Klebsiella aerogenes]ELN9407331.1 replication protein [Klebsiella aerogenes]HBR6969010.1 replication protein [Klebsiella aerogenes]HBY9540186.1 replication protein [Klebsiella aerogenes]
MQEFNQLTPHPGQSSKFRKPESSGRSNADLLAADTAWRLWTVMGEIFSNRWTQKNGAAPSDMWIAQIGAMSDAQITLVCRQCMERCAAGNTWPPDLAEFVALVSASGANPFNLTSEAVMAEYKRWRNESYRYSGSDRYPWKQDVLYHICVEMRRTGVERNLTEGELKKLAEKLLTKWTKHLANGFSIPPIRRQLEAPRHPAGPTPAQLLMEEYKRRKAAGLTR